MRFTFGFISLHQLHKPRELQPRAEINVEIVNQYAKRMLGKIRFPSITVFQLTGRSTYDREYYLVDGYHRLAAIERVFEIESPRADYLSWARTGRIYTKGIGKDPDVNIDPNYKPHRNTEPSLNADYHDAILYTAQANWDDKYFPRTSYDKKRQIYLILNHFPDWNDNRISKHCHINLGFVAQVAKKWRAREARWERERDMPVGL